MKKNCLSCRLGVKPLGFTLIELLIVVAIIAILAAIAVPNFLEAQTRAKVSRVKADMRTAMTAIESYRVDYSKFFPTYHEGYGDISDVDALAAVPPQETYPAAYDTMEVCGRHLTTPIAYLTAVIPRSPFQERNGVYNHRGFYVNRRFLEGYNEVDYLWYGFSPIWGNQNVRWFLMDGGPDRSWYAKFPGSTNPNELWEVEVPYDPTNGTVSQGNIFGLAGGGK